MGHIKDLKTTEAQEQVALFEWAERARGKYLELAMLYHIPNGGSRNPIEARHLREQGVRAGVPDICLPVPNLQYTALYIELKCRDGGRISSAQREWITALNRVGCRAVVCKGWDEARDEILMYLRQ